jgi:threonine dehydrogenase-like Zn-dependent dehydrogenase
MVDVPFPSVTKPDEVLVHVRASSICNQHEWKVFTDHYTGARKCAYPMSPGAPGHEGAGEVLEVGTDVRGLRVGDRVVLSGHAGDLHEEVIVAPQEFDYNDRPIEINPSEWFHKSLSIKTQAAFDLPIWAETVSYLDRQLIDPGRLVTQVLPFSAESYRQAMDLVERSAGYKIVLERPG